MKKLNLSLLLAFIFLCNVLWAQEDIKESKFSIIAYGSIGYGKVENNKEPNYDLHSNTGVVLLNYKLWKEFGLALGAGYTELSGNGFNSTGNFYQDRVALKIPLLMTLKSDLSEKITVFASFGPYAQTLIKDEFEYIDHTEKDVFEGWNFGTQLTFGVGFKLDNQLSFGFNLEGQSDFSKLDTDKASSINDKQKIKNLTTVGLFFAINL